MNFATATAAAQRPAKRRRVSASGSTSAGSGLRTPLSPSTSNASISSLSSESGSGSPPQQQAPSSKENGNNNNNSCSSSSSSILAKATSVLHHESLALSNIHKIYLTDALAQRNLSLAVSTILTSQKSRGKLIVSGVGKSAYIAQKLVATAKSLGISSSFMHACEAAHGDLGDLRDGDVLLFISFSGKTPELLNLLPHISPKIKLMAMSGVRKVEDCLLLNYGGDEGGILLPAPIHEAEERTFGVKAPTTSTTVALAVADMLVLTVADEMHRDGTSEVFAKNHPGGAIGMHHREVEKLRQADEDVSAVELPSPSISAESED